MTILVFLKISYTSVAVVYCRHCVLDTESRAFKIHQFLVAMSSGAILLQIFLKSFALDASTRFLKAA